MATLNGFLNPKKIETVKFALSDRFCDEDGTPLDWEIRCLSGEEVQAVQDECMVSKQAGNKITPELDTKKFQAYMLVKSVMTPNPNAADILDAYGVKDPEKLFGKMLTGAEYLTLFNKVSEVNGLNKDLDSLITEAKN